MTVNWYKVGNAKEFEAVDIPQFVQSLELENMGLVEIVFIKGFNISIIFNGEVLTPELNGRNPFFRNKTTSYIDPETKDIWVGYEVDLQ